ncbi:MAG: GUN4 domain-containing protein [Nostoc sp.]|uniref:GUN4 domain-containing protein n=1 Tax=Nostoc sp. TaxID=1180 RepID=UPI002FF8A306
MERPFDVFLAYNSLDKPEVQVIATALRLRNLVPWIDDEQIPPGRPFQDEIQQAIPLVKSAAIFIGVGGLGRWQNWELKSLMDECVEGGIPVIPVLLPGVEEIPKKFVFLKQFKWVSFSESISIIDDVSALDLLEWGITQIKPQPQLTKTSNRESATSQNQPTQTDNLDSEKGIDYTRLRDLLAAKNWKEADQETYRVMIQAVGKEYGDYLDEDELLNFPCTDLRTVDSLWVKYSNGHFGFSVQKEIYLSVGGKADGKYYEKVWEKFGDRVGWRVKINWISSEWISYSDVNFDTASPVGHLPSCVWGVGFSGSLFSRIKTCKL